MVFGTTFGGGRPVRLSEETRRFAAESLSGKYGDEAMRTPWVSVDDIAGFEDMEEYDKYDAMIRRIAEPGAAAGDGVRICLRRGHPGRGDGARRARVPRREARFYERQPSDLRF